MKLSQIGVNLKEYFRGYDRGRLDMKTKDLYRFSDNDSKSFRNGYRKAVNKFLSDSDNMMEYSEVY